MTADLYPTPVLPQGPPPHGWAEEIRSLAVSRNAVILAHNYMLPDIQDVADHVGDSLALSRIAAASDADTIVFCGVHFMAETAKILAPSKTVLIPDLDAGCSLAASIDVADVLAWKADHPDGVVVAYVNTSAAIKARSMCVAHRRTPPMLCGRSPKARKFSFYPTNSSARTCVG